MHIDPEQLGVQWAHTIAVRGVAVPVLSPDLIEGAADEPWLRGGLLGLARRIGRWLHRATLGQAPTGWVRDQVAKCVPREFRSHVAPLSAAELVRFAAVYQAMQERWVTQHTLRAAEALRDEAPAPQAAGTTFGAQLREKLAGVGTVNAKGGMEF